MMIAISFIKAKWTRSANLSTGMNALYKHVRFICLLVALLVCYSATADNHRSIGWFESAMIDGSLDFMGSVRHDGCLLPIYSETYQPTVQANSYSVALSFPVYERLTPDELKPLKPLLNLLPDSLQLNVSYGMDRKKMVLNLSFVPFIRKGSGYYKLTSFKWEITPVQSSAVTLRAKKSYASASQLASGKWKKLSVKESGLYKLTYEDIVNMGLNPSKIQIYGYGGNLLEEDFSKTGYQDDLPAVPVWKELGADSVFNKGDFILFYAKGPVSWTQNASGFFNRVRNSYSDKAYYFAGEREGGTLTVSNTSFSGTPNKQSTSFTDFLLHETDLVNIGESVASSGTGRELYGEDFVSIPDRTFTFDVPNVDTTQKSRIGVDFVAHNTSTSYCNLFVDDHFITAMSMSAISSSDLYTYGTNANVMALFQPTSDKMNVTLNYLQYGNSSTPRAFLNYIILNVRRKLKLDKSPLVFRDPNVTGTGNVARYTIDGANSTVKVFDVTDPSGMTCVTGSLSGSAYVFDAPASSLKEYVCVNLNGSIPSPTIEGNVANQNIHGYQPDMVIITPEAFKKQAARLAEVHTENDGLSVLVVTPEQVYNEFSSGTPDATAYRRMMKLFYDKATTESELPKYLLLFGGGVYDNRLVSAQFLSGTTKSNWLLTYESKESLRGSSSFVTDDYFGFLDDSEGSDLSSGIMCWL